MQEELQDIIKLTIRGDGDDHELFWVIYSLLPSYRLDCSPTYPDKMIQKYNCVYECIIDYRKAKDKGQGQEYREYITDKVRTGTYF